MVAADKRHQEYHIAQTAPSPSMVPADKRRQEYHISQTAPSP